MEKMDYRRDYDALLELAENMVQTEDGHPYYNENMILELAEETGISNTEAEDLLVEACNIDDDDQY